MINLDFRKISRRFLEKRKGEKFSFLFDQFFHPGCVYLLVSKFILEIDFSKNSIFENLISLLIFIVICLYFYKI